MQDLLIDFILKCFLKLLNLILFLHFFDYYARACISLSIIDYNLSYRKSIKETTPVMDRVNSDVSTYGGRRLCATFIFLMRHVFLGERRLLRKSIKDVALIMQVFSILASTLYFHVVTAETIEVPLDYPTIQEAINAASNGDTIFVHNGIYYENVVVNKTVSIAGQDKRFTIVDGNEPSVGFRIISDHVSITGFTIRDAFFGISLENNVEYCYIFGNNIRNNYHGIDFYDSCHNNIILENNITNSQVRGISIELCNNVTISGNNIENNGSGIGIVLQYSCHNNTISENNITDNDMGIFVDGYNVTISGNNIKNSSEYCIRLRDCVDNTVSANNIKNSLIGIALDGFRNTISGNNITDNHWHGISFDSANNNTISGNNIKNNAYYGIVLEDSSYNRFYHNSFMNNSQHVYLPTVVHPNFWDDGYPSGGNYWSDYDGADLYNGPDQNETGNDGLGDTPYIVGEGNTDMYPLMVGPFGSWTMIGENITVFPSQDIRLIFENIVTEGLTIADELESGPAPPQGMEVEQYYRIETTAVFLETIAIRILYNDLNMTQEQEESLQLMYVLVLLGDVDGDLDVDIYDIVAICNAYGSEQGQGGYDENCDFDRDGDIDIYDVVTACNHYGESYPDQWVDTTTHVDTENNSIFGITEHLSIFGITRLE